MYFEREKVIFLDIDGVLQSYDSKSRFSMDKEGLRDELTKKYNVDYTVYDEYDVSAAYSDWDINAVNRIRTIVEKLSLR